MIRTPTSLMLAWLLCAGPALAERDCAVPMTDWQPREAVERLAVEQGWQVRRIRIDDGCYEVIGRDAGGRAMELKLDPATLRIVEAEYEEPSADEGDEAEGD